MAKKQQYQLHLRGYVGGYDFDAGYVDYVLSRLEGQEVHVLIDSLGGSVATALSISSAFARHGNVSVHFCGMNASAATIASLGAKRITMDASAMYLVHKCSIDFALWRSMNAEKLEQFIAECRQQQSDLKKIDDNIAAMYSAKCKKSKDELLNLMAKGGWMTSEEALQWGFVDEITRYPEDTEKSIEAYEALAKFAASAYGINPQKQYKSTMEEKFNLVCAAVGVAALESQDGYVSFSLEQVQALENTLAEHSRTIDSMKEKETSAQSEIDDLKAQLATAEQQVASLRDNPAASTTGVVDTTSTQITSSLDDYAVSISAAKEMFNSLP